MAIIASSVVICTPRIQRNCVDRRSVQLTASWAPRKLVKGLLLQGHRQILLNLSDVTYIDSCGVGELVSAYTSAARQGGRIAFAAPSPRVREVLSISKLLGIFNVFDSETLALASFRTQAGLSFNG